MKPVARMGRAFVSLGRGELLKLSAPSFSLSSGAQDSRAHMGKGDLNQRSTAAWLRKATSEREVEEGASPDPFPRSRASLTLAFTVLSAYVFCKMRSGSTPTGGESSASAAVQRGGGVPAKRRLTFDPPRPMQL